MFFVAQERADVKPQAAAANEKVVTEPATHARFPRQFWLLVIGVLIFGLGDFSRTFLIFLAAAAFGGADSGDTAGALVRLSSIPMLLYAMHNAVSALAAYPAGHFGDRRAKLPILVVGYVLGVATNVLLIIGSDSATLLVVIFVFSGTYIAIEETLEKAVVADWLPRELRSLGLGTLACGNAVGDMASSLYVGALVQAGHPQWAFGIAAAFGAIGVAWMLWLISRRSFNPITNSE
jgi:MFS family permease